MFYAASGAAYALANLVLARRLPERDYAVFTLVLAMMALGPSLAAAGLDGVAVRGALRFVPGVAVRVWLAAGLIALALAGASASYGVEQAVLGRQLSKERFRGGRGARSTAPWVSPAGSD